MLSNYTFFGISSVLFSKEQALRKFSKAARLKPIRTQNITLDEDCTTQSIFQRMADQINGWADTLIIETSPGALNPATDVFPRSKKLQFYFHPD